MTDCSVYSSITNKKAIIPVRMAFINKYFVGICVDYRKGGFLLLEAAAALAEELAEKRPAEKNLSPF